MDVSEEAAFPVDYYDVPTVNDGDRCLRSHRRINSALYKHPSSSTPISELRELCTTPGVYHINTSLLWCPTISLLYCFLPCKSPNIRLYLVNKLFKMPLEVFN